MNIKETDMKEILCVFLDSVNNFHSKSNEDKEKCITELMQSFGKSVYIRNINMQYMDYECIIENKLDRTFDDIIIEIKTKDDYDPYSIESSLNTSEPQDGIYCRILISIDDIIRVLTPNNISTMNKRCEFELYEKHRLTEGYYYTENNDRNYIEWESGQCMLLVSSVLDNTGDDTAPMCISLDFIDNFNKHGFSLTWNYYDYIKFYSHIIEKISVELGDLSKNYGIEGE